MPALKGFNPSIDRFDQRSAAKLFEFLWPDQTISRAVALHLAGSIQVAHATANASWEITMFRNFIRLNVGQVETLTLSERVIRFLFRAPLELGPDQPFDIRATDEPVYRSVPVKSGVCFVSPDDLSLLPKSVRDAHEAYIQAAASFKKSTRWKDSFSPAILDHVESVLGIELPRPTYLTGQHLNQRVLPLADELDFVQPILEGAKYQITVNAYERDPEARRLCISKHGTTCVICGFSFAEAYGPLADGLIHVHHIRPLSEMGGKYQVDPVQDLRPVCPNCHAVLHRRRPAYGMEEVQKMLRR